MPNPATGEDTGNRTVVLLVGDVTTVPPQIVAELVGRGILVAEVSGPDVARQWLATMVPDEGPRHAIMAFDRLEIDRERHVATWDARPLSLTEQEFQVLIALAEVRGNALPFKELQKRVWGDSHRRDTATTLCH
jgi:DNA-binding response OmpR family regulator